jgi:hypothetical protein
MPQIAGHDLRSNEAALPSRGLLPNESPSFPANGLLWWRRVGPDEELAVAGGPAVFLSHEPEPLVRGQHLPAPGHRRS